MKSVKSFSLGFVYIFKHIVSNALLVRVLRSRRLLPALLLRSSAYLCEPSLFALLLTQALERQKEFFDSIRSERDDLREEVVMLKEEIKV